MQAPHEPLLTLLPAPGGLCIGHLLSPPMAACSRGPHGLALPFTDRSWRLLWQASIAASLCLLLQEAMLWQMPCLLLLAVGPGVCRDVLTLMMYVGSLSARHLCLCRVKLRPSQEVIFPVGTVMTHRRYDYSGDFVVSYTELFALTGL